MNGDAGGYELQELECDEFGEAVLSEYEDDYTPKKVPTDSSKSDRALDDIVQMTPLLMS